MPAARGPLRQSERISCRAAAPLPSSADATSVTRRDSTKPSPFGPQDPAAYEQSKLQKIKDRGGFRLSPGGAIYTKETPHDYFKDTPFYRVGWMAQLGFSGVAYLS